MKTTTHNVACSLGYNSFSLHYWLLKPGYWGGEMELWYDVSAAKLSYPNTYTWPSNKPKNTKWRIIVEDKNYGKQELKLTLINSVRIIFPANGHWERHWSGNLTCQLCFYLKGESQNLFGVCFELGNMSYMIFNIVIYNFVTKIRPSFQCFCQFLTTSLWMLYSSLTVSNFLVQSVSEKALWRHDVLGKLVARCVELCPGSCGFCCPCMREASQSIL